MLLYQACYKCANIGYQSLHRIRLAHCVRVHTILAGIYKLLPPAFRNAQGILYHDFFLHLHFTAIRPQDSSRLHRAPPQVILYHDSALLHHGSRTFAKCLLRIRLAHCVRVYYIISTVVSVRDTRQMSVRARTTATFLVIISYNRKELKFLS